MQKVNNNMIENKIVFLKNMIQAHRIIDIANANTTEQKVVTRSRVQYHCKKGNYQAVILPIKKLYPDQASEITMYLPGYLVAKDMVQKNPIKLIPVEMGKVTKSMGNIVWCMYWNAMRFYTLPKGYELIKASDPTGKSQKFFKNIQKAVREYSKK